MLLPKEDENVPEVETLSRQEEPSGETKEILYRDLTTMHGIVLTC